MIKGVIFDVGGVILRIPNREYHIYLDKRSGKTTMEVERIISRSLPEAESGKADMRAFEKKLSSRLGIKPSELNWLMPLKGAEVDMDVMELVKELSGNYAVGYLTNVDRSRYIYAARLIGDDYFAYKFVSCYMHMVKPQHAIYRYVLKKMRLKPQELVFIDNEPSNVRGARELGINAVLFHGRRALDISLSGLGLF